MNKKLAAVLIFLIFHQAACFGQRCGGSLTFSIYDSAKHRLYPAFEDSTQKVDFYVDGKMLYEGFKITTLRIERGSKKLRQITYLKNGKKTLFFNLPTGCGIPLWHISVKNAEKKMEIKFKNIPYDIDFLFDSIPFKEGIFTIDINRIGQLRMQDRKKNNWFKGIDISPAMILKKEEDH
jgi:hypothetical protein